MQIQQFWNLFYLFSRVILTLLKLKRELELAKILERVFYMNKRERMI